MASLPSPQQHSNWWKPIYELVIHVLVGTLLFTVISVPAIVLDLAISWMEVNLSVSAFLSALLLIVKIAIALIDVIVYLVFMVVMALRFVKEIWPMRNPNA
ncbi:MAG TPA: hypothetical protein VG097_06360 [Gemmata sp.]|jgi:hypothetical protein|nr:hypothetical protein [Gemmata sp.]